MNQLVVYFNIFLIKSPQPSEMKTNMNTESLLQCVRKGAVGRPLGTVVQAMHCRTLGGVIYIVVQVDTRAWRRETVLEASVASRP